MNSNTGPALLHAVAIVAPGAPIDLVHADERFVADGARRPGFDLTDAVRHTPAGGPEIAR